MKSNNRTAALLAVILAAAVLFGGCQRRTPDPTESDTSADPGATETAAQPTASSTTAGTAPSVPTTGTPTSGTTTARDPRLTTTLSGLPTVHRTTTTRRSTTTAPDLPTTTTTARPPEVSRQSLRNTLYALTVERQLTVGYLGGSVTSGNGSTDRTTRSWRALLTAWMRETYPEAAVTEVDASLGGTGSYFGAMRLQEDLLSRTPDLLFVEFAINDSYLRTSYESSARYMESIVRRCYAADPAMDIVLVYTTDAGKRGQPTKWTQAFDRVADAYGLQVIDVGKAMAKADSRISNLFCADKMHPNDTGYQVIFEEMREKLSAALEACADEEITKRADHPLPTPLRDDLLLETQIITAEEIDELLPALSLVPSASNIPYSCVIIPPEATLSIPFEGTSIGAYWTGSFDDMLCSVDGADPLIFNPGTDATQDLLFDGLEPGEHTLTMTNQGNKGIWLSRLLVAK